MAEAEPSGRALTGGDTADVIVTPPIIVFDFVEPEAEPETDPESELESKLVDPVPPPISVKRPWRESLVVPFALSALVIGLAHHFSGSIPPPPLSVGQKPSSQSKTPQNIAQAIAAAVPVQTALVAADALPPAQVSPASDAAVVMARPPEDAVIDVAAAEIVVRDADFVPRQRACSLSDAELDKRQQSPTMVPTSPDAFGVALATAAEAQTRDFVIYNDEYRSLRYPGGDVSPLYGVCSDVVIRAYRALGIDLQRAVHESRAGAGDVSIDHRRTETLRRFFLKRSSNLTVTSYAEDYLPGDIVTYERPQNRHGQAHIAIVANQTGPSGRPMIIHNRGWGPQIEDALFVDQITGHYRLSGAPEAKVTDRDQPKYFGPGTTWLSIKFERASQSKAKRR